MNGEEKISVSKKKIEDIIVKASFKKREYQVDSIYKILKNIERNRSSILNLPQGLGKTLIGQVISVLLRDTTLDDKAKALTLIPTRSLYEQHREMASWMRKYGKMLEFEPQIKNFGPYLRNRFKICNYVITTPILFFNNLKKFDREDLKQIKLCILDEFDTFSVADWDKKKIIRFNKSMEGIINFLLEQKCIILGLTASRLNSITLDFWTGNIDMDLLKPKSTDKDIKGYLPYNNIIPLGIQNEKIIDYNDKIKKFLARNYEDLQNTCNQQGLNLPLASLDYFINRIIKSGVGKFVRVGNRELKITYDIFELAIERRSCISARLKSFEDSLPFFNP
ncbi:MAG: DEAD/DEAH box helicase family protein, partial [Candidatus Hodarchaeota archaeon]